MENLWFWGQDSEWSSILSMKGCSLKDMIEEEERLRYRATGYINQIGHRLGVYVEQQQQQQQQ